MSEFYIRREGDEEAIGPYNIDQLSSLVDAKKLDGDAFYYNMDTEEWDKLSSNKELMNTLYPIKRKLSLRKDDEAAAPPKAKEAAPTEDLDDLEDPEELLEAELAKATESEVMATEIAQKSPASANPKPSSTQKKENATSKNLSVAEMLAAAEGRHLEKSHGKTPTEIKAKAAYLCLQICTLLFFLSAATMVYIDIDTIMAADALKIAKSPFVITALVDLLFGLFLALQVTSLYPLVRFRAAIGIGFYTFMFYSIEQPILLLGNLLLMVAIYFATAVMELKKAYATIALGIAGVVAYAYVLLMPLLN